MIKLLIADDEAIIRQSLSKIIDWKTLGIKLVGTAKNGIDAYEQILDKYPDIVLTDIKMPGLSGIELIKKIYQINPEVKFIILSAYGEFQYAQEAMIYGVKHYLLKPCDESQIIETVKKIKQEIKENRKEIKPKKIVKTPETVSQQIIKYVEENIQRPDLSLKNIAETQIFMNVDYLSKKFQKETGMKFSTYLTKTRIKKSIELINENPNIPINQIAQSIGCENNPHYFSQIFKKETGLTPTNYIKNLQDKSKN